MRVRATRRTGGFSFCSGEGTLGDVLGGSWLLVARWSGSWADRLSAKEKGPANADPLPPLRLREVGHERYDALKVDL
jgi:hypothetical protein